VWLFFGAQKREEFQEQNRGLLLTVDDGERESMGEKMLGGTTTRIQKLSIWNIITMIPQKKFSVLFFVVVLLLLDLMASSYVGR
jgi:hypothetical protein